MNMSWTLYNSYMNINIILISTFEHIFHTGFWGFGVKSEKVFTICLTATAYDGTKDGLQKSALNELGY